MLSDCNNGLTWGRCFFDASDPEWTFAKVLFIQKSSATGATFAQSRVSILANAMARWPEGINEVRATVTFGAEGK